MLWLCVVVAVCACLVLSLFLVAVAVFVTAVWCCGSLLLHAGSLLRLVSLFAALVNC